MATTIQDKKIRKMLLKCDEVSQTLKSVSHPIRLKVLCQLMDGPKSVSELTEFCEIPQAAMSQFLARMKKEGVLDSKRSGTFIYYEVNDPNLIELIRSLKEIFCS